MTRGSDQRIELELALFGYPNRPSSRRQFLCRPRLSVLQLNPQRRSRLLLENLGIRCALLTGSTTAKAKRSIVQQLESGEIDFAIGTHALITGSVAYRDLGLVVTDEQHRFGVAQRADAGRQGGPPPHPGHVRHAHPPDAGPDSLR